MGEVTPVPKALEVPGSQLLALEPFLCSKEPSDEGAEPDEIAVRCKQDLYEERKAIAADEESKLPFEVCCRARELYFDDFGDCSSVLFFGDLGHERGNIFI